MTHIEQMIQDMCPNGVEFKTLGEVLDYEQPTPYIVKNTDYDESYSTPVLTAGQSFILGYTNEKEGIYKASKEQPTIIFDDFTTSFHWVDFDFKVKSSAMKMLRPKNDANINFRFVFYAMQCIKFQATEHTRYWISKYSQFPIPLPPIEIQKKIVECLDKFSALAAELQAELHLRRKQYEYYRTQLLTPHSDCNSATKPDDCNWEWKTLGEICENCDYMRRPITATHREKGEYPYYGASGIVDYVKDYIFDGEYLLISEDGANLVARSTPIAFSIKGRNWVNNHAHVLKFEHRCTQKLVEYFINSINVEPYVSGGAQPKLNQANLNKISIPLPSLAEQERIVSILDKFEALTTSLSDGIPAEQAAQQKRYEYYRDLLLTFDRKAV